MKNEIILKTVTSNASIREMKLPQNLQNRLERAIKSPLDGSAAYDKHSDHNDHKEHSDVYVDRG